MVPLVHFARADLSVRARMTLVALSAFTDRFGKCWPKVATLAELLHVDERTVQRALSELESVGLLVREFRSASMQSTVYRVVRELPAPHDTRDIPAGDMGATPFGAQNVTPPPAQLSPQEREHLNDLLLPTVVVDAGKMATATAGQRLEAVETATEHGDGPTPIDPFLRGLRSPDGAGRPLAPRIKTNAPEVALVRNALPSNYHGDWDDCVAIWPGSAIREVAGLVAGMTCAPPPGGLLGDALRTALSMRAVPTKQTLLRLAARAADDPTPAPRVQELLRTFAVLERQLNNDDLPTSEYKRLRAEVDRVQGELTAAGYTAESKYGR